MKNKIKIFLLFISMFLLLGTSDVRADISKENFVRIGIKDGLSSSTITAIYQDSKGYMWIGTADGLNKYNGYNVSVYNYEIGNEQSLSATYITAILEDEEENMWIGTKDGLNILNKNTEKIIRIPTGMDNVKGITDSKITALFKDSKNNIWIGTENGLNMYNKDEGIFKKYIFDLENGTKTCNNHITDIKEDINGYLLVATKCGINIVNLENYAIVDNEKPCKERKYIYSMEEDNKNNLWMATDEGLYKYDMVTKELTLLNIDIEDGLNSKVENIFSDSNNNLWLSSTNGAIKYNQDTESFTVYKNDYLYDYSLSSDYVNTFYEDKNNNIWIGTSNGLNILSNSQQFTTILNYGKAYYCRNITDIVQTDNGEIWMGTLYNGIFRYNEENLLSEQIYYNNDEDMLHTNYINAMIKGPKNIIIAATKGGIILIDEKDGSFTRLGKEKISRVYNEEIIDIYYSNDILWIGSINGFYSYNMKSEEFIDYTELFSAIDSEITGIRCIFSEDENSDILWLGGNNKGGLIKFNKKTNEVKNFPHDINDNTSITYNSVNTIVKDDDGNIWVGADCGLNKFNIETESFENFSKKDGLGSNVIKSMAFDKVNNYLWITTNEGISSFSIVDNSFRNYTAIDGISDNEFCNNSVLTINGYIVFGGSVGITYFDTNNIKVNKSEDIDVVIDYFKSNDVIAYNEDSIRLNYKYMTFNVNYFTTNYVEKEKITYEYMLEGVDDDWVYTNNYNNARYTSLKPGKYVFKVRAKMNGNISDITTLDITIEKPFWSTSMAYVIYFIIIALIVFFMLNHVKILNNLVMQRTNELNNQLVENKNLYNRLINEEKFKNAFFVNLSHELRTPLNVIISTVQLMNVVADKNQDNRMKKYIKIIKKSSESLLRTINDIIDSSKIETGHYNINKKAENIVYIVEEAALNMNEYIKVNGLELIVDPEIEEKEVYCDATEIERIIVNLLSNAVKFTPKGGKITVLIMDKGEKVEIIVEDTGTGISKEDQEFIFNRFEQGQNRKFTNISSSGIGLTLVKYLVELHNGEIRLESEVGKGSRFIISLPVK